MSGLYITSCCFISTYVLQIAIYYFIIISNKYIRGFQMIFEWDDEKDKINGTFMVVTVVYTERRENIRIISARLATGAEKEAYYDSKNNS